MVTAKKLINERSEECQLSIVGVIESNNFA